MKRPWRWRTELHREKAYILHQPRVIGVVLHPVDWIRLGPVDVEQ